MKVNKTIAPRLTPILYIAVTIALFAALRLSYQDARAASNPLSDTPWPTYGQNALRNGRSPYNGSQQIPTLRWSFARSNDHWGTDYRGIGIGNDNTVYLAAGMAGVYAIDSKTGNMKWLFSPWATGHETWVEFPPTIGSDGTLYVTSENDYIYALDPNGNIIWYYLSQHLHTPVSISPDGSTVHFVSEDGNLYALGSRNGSLRWRYQLSTRGLYATGRRIPVVYDDAGNLYFCWFNAAWSLTPSGELRWCLPELVSETYMVGPAVSNDTLYFISSNLVLAVTFDGQLKWRFPLDSTAFDRTPAIGTDGTIYIGTDNGIIYAINPNGSLNWRQQYVARAGWGGGIKSNLLLDAQGILFFLGKDQNVYAVSTSTRNVLWKYFTAVDNNSYPGIQLALDDDGTIYVPVDEKKALALAPAPTSSTPDSTPTHTPTPTFAPIPPTTTPTTTSVAATATRTPTVALPTSTPTTAPPTATPTLVGTTPLGENLLSNSGFEQATNGSIPDNWVVASSNYSSLVSRSSDPKRSGSFSMLVGSSRGESFAVFQDVSVNPGERYKLSGYLNVPSCTAWFRASIQLVVLNRFNGTIYTSTPLSQSSATNGWIAASQEIDIPNNGAVLRVQIKLESLKAKVYLDDFSLTRTR